VQQAFASHSENFASSSGRNGQQLSGIQRLSTSHPIPVSKKQSLAAGVRAYGQRISREALRKRVLSGSVLALRDDADLIRYPRWQFDAGNSAPYKAIKELNEIFGDVGLDSWTLASFATAPQPELGNRAPVDAFADADIEPLLLSAHRTVADLKR
jgi:hypothetical protein